MEDVLVPAMAVLAATPERWLSLAKMLPEGLLRRAPAEAEWSALDCLQHLCDTEQQVFPVRVRYLLVGQDFPAFDPDSQGGLGTQGTHPLELASAFMRMRLQSLQDLALLTFDDLARQARHQELGMVTLGELIHEWAAHDLMHTVQAERAMMQPFIHGSGPWQRYFSDHLQKA
jgi:hypothetical protein